MKGAIKFRIACRNDAPELARLHFSSAMKQPGGFMHLLGVKFLQAYYEILLDEGSSTILCAYVTSQRLVGFAAGSIQAESRIKALKGHRIKLFFSCARSLISNPRLIAELRARENTGSPEESQGFVINSGPHVEYWAWDTEAGGGGGAITLLKKWLSLMRLMGITKVRGEVDDLNPLVLKIHQLLGAHVTSQFHTPNGNLRHVIEYSLK